MGKSKKDKATSRKKKTKKLKYNEQQRKIRSKKRDKYPEFIIDNYDKNLVDEEYVKDVSSILKRINFEDKNLFTRLDQEFYKLMKLHGHEFARNAVLDLLPDKDNQKNIFITYITCQIGDIVFRNLKDNGLLKKYVPRFDFSIVPYLTNYKVMFDALKYQKTKFGRMHYSRKEPKVNIDGDDFIVAFSKHAIERIYDRCVAVWDMYAGYGDAFAFLNHCKRFDVISQEHQGKTKYYLTFWNKCTKGFFKYDYVLNLVENIDENKTYYYRVGYCPVGLNEQLACSITLLTPGMIGTPERQLIESSVLDNTKKKELLNGIENMMILRNFAFNPDFKAVKWFHDNGIPQVIETDEEIFDYK